jgi:hypothetical protein
LLVQLTALSSERQRVLQDLLLYQDSLYALPFPRRPQSVFDGVEMPVAILLLLGSSNPKLVTSRINRFYQQERPSVTERFALHDHTIRVQGYRIAKLGSPSDQTILDRLYQCRGIVTSIVTTRSNHEVYYQEACRYWVKALNHIPQFYRNGELMPPQHGRVLRCVSSDAASFLTCLLNSSLFYWIYSALSDCEHINDTLIQQIPIPSDWQTATWDQACQKLMTDIRRHSTAKTIFTKQGHTIRYEEMNAAQSKPVIDQIDRMLAQQYGLLPHELDFIINYDIKYRMGRDAEADGDD